MKKSKEKVGVSSSTPWGVIPYAFSVGIRPNAEQQKNLWEISKILHLLFNKTVEEIRRRIESPEAERLRDESKRLSQLKKFEGGESVPEELQKSFLLVEETIDSLKRITSSTSIGLNYVLSKWRNGDDSFAMELKKLNLSDLRQFVLYVCGAVKSAQEKQKHGDPRARFPKPVSEKDFQTPVWLLEKPLGLVGGEYLLKLPHSLNGEKETLTILVPKSTGRAINGKPIIHAKVTWSEEKEWHLELVVNRRAPEPAILKKVVGLEVGANKLAWVLSQERKKRLSFFSNVRNVSSKDWSRILELRKQLKPLDDGFCLNLTIQDIDQQISELDWKKDRSKVNDLKEQKMELLKPLRKSSEEYQKIWTEKRRLEVRASNRLKDWQRKCVSRLIGQGDVFIVYKPLVARGKDTEKKTSPKTPIASTEEGTAEQHRKFASGPISRFLQMLQRECDEAGKLYIEIPLEFKRSEMKKLTDRFSTNDPATAVSFAEENLLNGITSSEFQDAVNIHTQAWTSGKLIQLGLGKKEIAELKTGEELRAKLLEIAPELRELLGYFAKTRSLLDPSFPERVKRVLQRNARPPKRVVVRLS